MAKHLLEDMVKTKRINRKIGVKNAPILQKEEIQEKIFIKREVYTSETKDKNRYGLWIVAFISVVFCFFAISFLFSKAEVVVNQKTESVVLNENLSASKDANMDVLPFDSVVISGTENTTVKTLGEKKVSTSATGMVYIYNAFSSTSQSLNIDTRLEGSNGKIYKTTAKTTVPGMNKDGTPGSVAVKIYGSVAGADYNSSPLDFKILGFKGTSKYAKIYARSSGDITGGFIGQAPDMTDADNAAVVNSLTAALQAKLLAQASNQIPSGFILFKNAVFLNINDSNGQPNISSTYDNNSNMTTVTLTGTLYGILFNEQKLTQKIAEDSVDKYDGSDVYIPSIRDLTFTLTNKDNVSFDNVQNINFNLSGKVLVVWRLDADKFMADLLGKSKSDFNKILSQYPNIDSATLTISPIWKTYIPDKAKNIKVIVNYTK